MARALHLSRMRQGLRRALIIIGIVAVAAGAARLAAPAVVKRYVNRELADIGEYRGSITDVQLDFIRGRYVIRNLEIVKRDSTPETPPFATIPSIDLSVLWRALFKGQRVGDVVMHSPQINLVQSQANQEKQLGTGVNWPQEIRDLVPFQLNLVEARDGLVTFRAPGISTNDSLTIRGLQMQLRNLTNVQDRDEPAFADIEVHGQIMGNAPLTLTGQIDPNEQTPTFDVDLTIEGARLVDVNPWLREFLKVDAEMGVFSMYSELAAAENRFEGYVRPILENPQFFDSERGRAGPVPQSLGRPRQHRGEDLGEQAGAASRHADPVARRVRESEPRHPDRDGEPAAQRVRRRVLALARRLDHAARRRDRRALLGRRAAGRGAAGPRTIAPGAPARSLLTPSPSNPCRTSPGGSAAARS